MRGVIFPCILVACFCAFCPVALGDAPACAATANVLSLAEGSDESFAGLFGGDDLLPYTDDDNVLNDAGNFGGNPFGSWGFGHMDHNSNNKIDDGEPLFHSTRFGPFAQSLVDQGLADPEAVEDFLAGDDDSTFYTNMTRMEYGVLYECEDWVGFVEANQNGPNGIRDGADTDHDFEINDGNGWEHETNAYVYNNLGNNQHGLGYSKYRVDYKGSPSEDQPFHFDEIEGWQKTFQFQNTADDPDTEHVENSGCNRFYRVRDSLDMRGYLIPLNDLEGLEDGSLPSLFGWEAEDFDYAAWFRDTIRPLLDHDDLLIWNETAGYPTEEFPTLPVTHVYLLQYSCPMATTAEGGDCAGDQATYEAHSAYWGIPLGGSGTWRQSFLMGLSVDFTNNDMAELLLLRGLHEFRDTPADGAELNLWHQDHFFRADNSHLGKYTFEPAETTWEIRRDDLTFSMVSGMADSFLTSSGAGTVSAPLSKALSAAETPIIVVADLAATLSLLPPDGIDCEAAEDGVVALQIIARSGDKIVAYADISTDQTRVTLGGVYDSATGRASGGTPGTMEPGAVIGEVDCENEVAEYTRFVLIVNGDGASLRQVEASDYATDSFIELELIGEELASASGDTPFGAGVAHVSLGTSGATAINTILVFASPGIGPFLRGDCDADGKVGGSPTEAIILLVWAFRGGPEPPCLAACDFNGDGKASGNPADAVGMLTFSFRGGNPPSAPFPLAAYSQNPLDALTGCVEYNP